MIHVLTRLGGDVAAFSDLRRGLLAQHYPHVRHLTVATGDEALAYAEGDVIVAVPQLYQHGLKRQSARRQWECSRPPSPDDALRLLHRYVSDGWVLYVGEDQLLRDPAVLAIVLAHATSTRSLLRWDVGGHKADMFAVGGFMFHSSHLPALAADINARCEPLLTEWTRVSAKLELQHIKLLGITNHRRVQRRMVEHSGE
jgi:hypothetical protein